jgi:hypothetical protein
MLTSPFDSKIFPSFPIADIIMATKEKNTARADKGNPTSNNNNSITSELG